MYYNQPAGNQDARDIMTSPIVIINITRGLGGGQKAHVRLFSCFEQKILPSHRHEV